MSDDLIKRSDAIKAVEKRKEKIVYNYESNKWFNKMISEIEAIPSADLNAEFAEWAKLWFKKELEADRPQGEWKKTRNVHAWDVMGVESWGVERKCTNCGFKHIFIEDHGHYNFCPNCGADMRERKESDR